MANVKRGSHELELASASRVPIATIRSAVRHFLFAIGVPQKPDCPSSSGWPSARQPFPISVCATGTSSASASAVSSSVARADSTPPPAYSTGPLGRGQRVDDARGRRRIQSLPGDLRRHLVERVHREVGGEHVHRHVHEHRTGTPRLRQMERALHDARQILDAIDAVHALAERPEDLELIGVLMQVHFLMRMPAVVVRRHVAGNHDHRESNRARHWPRRSRRWSARARGASARRRPCPRRGRSRRRRARQSARGGSRRNGCGSSRARRGTR